MQPCAWCEKWIAGNVKDPLVTLGSLGPGYYHMSCMHLAAEAKRTGARRPNRSVRIGQGPDAPEEPAPASEPTPDAPIAAAPPAEATMTPVTAAPKPRSPEQEMYDFAMSLESE